MATEASASACQHGVRIVSRRMVRPANDGETTATKPKSTETVHLTPWDLQMLTVDYIQMGVLLPRPPTPTTAESMVDHPYAGRLATEEHTGGSGNGNGVTVSLQCTGDGAEFVHAVAADTTVADVAGSLRIPRVVWSFFPLNGMVGAHAAVASSPRIPVLAAQVTELADGVFVAMSLNHGVADGTAFWHLFNTWSEISRSSEAITTPEPVLGRWFPDACPVPVPLPFPTLDHAVRPFHSPPVEECFLAFSAESIRSLKARANAEISGTATVSSLQSLLAHLWVAVTRARRLRPEQETSYTLAVSCRGRVKRVPQLYSGNSMVRCATAKVAAGELLRGGLCPAAWRLNRAVASCDEAALVGSTVAWHAEPRFAYLVGWWDPALLVTGNSPQFDVFGNDFGWGRPVAVRSGGGNKVDGRATVYELGRGGGIGMELCLAPEALARLIADDEFMAVVNQGQ
ncbi:uncharacterized acetyltransferase At3g50280-like [Triticum dicoccoides]|uniref:uncharacterized acetyltransferase At3g50280-like n=1 Tax=Triticum dicoccoides TaxID=85692 RepID=UPI00188F0A74|nr:uncharacterized acetyltransferase At3g50280-like [Triticum dicoccoides]